MNTRRFLGGWGGVAIGLLCAHAALAAPAKPAPKTPPKAPPKPSPTAIPPHKRPAPTPVNLTLQLKLAAADGFFDDAIAFARDGKRIAVVHTDGQTFTRAEVFELPAVGTAPTPSRTIDLAPFTQQVADLAFLADGQTLFVKERIVEDGVARPARAQLYKLDGTVLRSYGPVTDIVLTEHAGQEIVVTYHEKSGKKGVTYEIVASNALTGKSVGKRSLAADSEDFIKSVDLRLGFFANHYLVMHARQRGAFDKAKDMRLPDRAAVYDVLAGKLISTADIQDLREAQRLTILRKSRPHVAAFVRVTDDLRAVELINSKTPDRAIAVGLAEDMIKYDPKSVHEQLSQDEKRIFFSLTIDPVNLVAVDKKIADIEYIDIYGADAESGAGARLGRLPAQGRPFGWRVAGDQWAFLRKHKGFSRGGPDLEIYKVIAK